MNNRCFYAYYANGNPIRVADELGGNMKSNLVRAGNGPIKAMRMIFTRTKGSSRAALAIASILMCALSWPAGLASAASDSSMTMTQLIAATPFQPQVQLSPGQSVNLPAKSWVENEIGQSWLTS